MNATIQNLWDTDRQILICDNESRLKDFDELKDCDNIVVLSKRGKNLLEILVDDELCLVSEVRLQHPAGGAMYAIEVKTL